MENICEYTRITDEISLIRMIHECNPCAYEPTKKGLRKRTESIDAAV